MMVQLLQHFFKRLVRNPPLPMRLAALLGAIIAYGASGFLYFELPGNPDLNWVDALWYTLVTMTTVGYGDFFPKTTGGRFLVGWPVMMFGIGLLGYVLSVIASALVSSKAKEIKGMTTFHLVDHLVIINFPSLEKVEQILDELVLDATIGKSTPIVLVDDTLEELPAELQARRVHFVRGKPTRDETLTRACIDAAAHAMVLCKVPGDPASDNLNVAIALAIEMRNKAVQTVVECVDPSTEELLRKAGCDGIVCASRFEANFMAQELLNPGLQDVLEDLLSAKHGQQLYLVPISRPAPFAQLAATCRGRGHIALGVRGAGGLKLNVSDEHRVQVGDRLVTLGPSRLDGI
ncbi:MAG: Ion transport 2 domain protein [Cyanobacteria bacterium RYN_339]|nr:Ion transport 2 domain protein [Cyanobacteria bacterium RYN_339]